jgi:hypothetical protein
MQRTKINGLDVSCIMIENTVNMQAYAYKIEFRTTISSPECFQTITKAYAFHTPVITSLLFVESLHVRLILGIIFKKNP